jgi:hypothetical protein
MNDQNTAAAWEQIVEILHEKLQYGLIEQLKSVSDVNIASHELTLTVNTDEAIDYFSAEINQQRLIILARPVLNLAKVLVVKGTAE